MNKYIVVYKIRFDDEDKSELEELSDKHLFASVIEAESYCDAQIKFNEAHDKYDFKIWSFEQVKLDK